MLRSSSRILLLLLWGTLAGVCPIAPPSILLDFAKKKAEHYFVWISVDFGAGFLWLFFGVETVGRTIEELDACFAKFPPKASWKRTKIVKDVNEEIGVKVADMGA